MATKTKKSKDLPLLEVLAEIEEKELEQLKIRKYHVVGKPFYLMSECEWANNKYLGKRELIQYNHFLHIAKDKKKTEQEIAQFNRAIKELYL